MTNHHQRQPGAARGRRLLNLACLAVYCGALLACGGESEESSGDSGTPSGTSTPGFSSGLPDSEPLGSLDEDERAALCDSFTDYTYDRLLGDARDQFCRFTSLMATSRSMPTTDEELLSECARYFDVCLTLEEEDLASSAVQTCPSIGPGCTATVAEYEQCFTDAQLAYEAKLLELPSCDEVTLSDLPVQFPIPSQPASCITYAQDCSG